MSLKDRARQAREKAELEAAERLNEIKRKRAAAEQGWYRPDRFEWKLKSIFEGDGDWEVLGAGRDYQRLKERDTGLEISIDEDGYHDPDIGYVQHWTVYASNVPANLGVPRPYNPNYYGDARFVLTNLADVGRAFEWLDRNRGGGE